MSVVKNIIRSVCNKEKLNILVAPFNGLFEDMLATTGHNLFCVPQLSKYRYVGTKAKIVENPNLLPIDLELDVIICNDRVVQYNVCSELSHRFHIPLIVVEHYNPANMLRQDDIPSIKAGQKHNGYVYVAESINDFWHENGEFIPYGLIERDCIEKLGLLVCGHFNQMEHASIAQMMADIPLHKIINLNTQNMSLDEINKACQAAQIFISFNMHNNIDIPLLYAMNNGCAVIAARLPILDGIVSKEGGILCSGPQEFVNAAKFMSSSDAITENMGNFNRKIFQRFNMDNFKEKWNTVLNTTISNGYL